jgi:hypothetical protein
LLFAPPFVVFRKESGVMNGTTATTDNLQGQRFFSILGNLRQDLTDMIKREVTLLKTEFSAKASCLGRQGAFIAAGGLVALIGAELLIIGLCAFIAFGLVKAGLSPLVASAIAFAAFGLILGAGGFMVLKKGINTFKETSYAPEQTLHTVKEITKPDANPIRAHAGAATEDSEAARKVRAARSAAERKIEQVQSEAAEIRARLQPKYMWAATCTAVQRRPKMFAGIGASLVAVGYLFIRRRRSHMVVLS